MWQKNPFSKRNIMLVLGKILPIFFFSTILYAAPQRVAQIDFDLTKVFKLYSSPGRDTTIYFPCNVEYATSGTAGDIKLSLPKKFPNLVTVFLLHSKSESTSLKVLCADRVFVFDIVPSIESHIDFLKIAQSHGELPRYNEKEMPRRVPELDNKEVSSTKSMPGKIIFSSKKKR
jgi:hypothetical protein